METNPVVAVQLQQEAERRAREDFRYPYHIVCVYLPSHGVDFPIIHEVRDYCNANNLTFMSRPYDIDKHEVDMLLNRLPAFYIYSKGYPMETHYYDKNPIYGIQKVIWEYQDEDEARERARRRRQETWESFKALFSLERFKKKPALNLDASLKPHTQ